MQLEVRVYGDGSLPGALFEDDGETFDYAKGRYNTVRLTWDPMLRQGEVHRQGNAEGVPQHTVLAWLPAIFSPGRGPM